MDVTTIHRIARATMWVVLSVSLWCVQANADGYDVDGRPLTRNTLFGDVDGSRSTVGQVADFSSGGGGGGSGITTNDVNTIVQGVVTQAVVELRGEIGLKQDALPKSESGTYEISVTNANTAGSAAVAYNDQAGQSIRDTYATKQELAAFIPSRISDGTNTVHASCVVNISGSDYFEFTSGPFLGTKLDYSETDDAWYAQDVRGFALIRLKYVVIQWQLDAKMTSSSSWTSLGTSLDPETSKEITFNAGTLTQKSGVQTKHLAIKEDLKPSDIGAVSTNDTRLADARTPTAHASSHATGGTDVITPASIGAQTALNPTQIGIVNGGPYLPTSGGELTSSSSSEVGITLKGGVGEYYSGGDAEVKSGSEGNPASIVLNGGVYRGAILEVKEADDPTQPMSEKASIKKGGKEVATEDQIPTSLSQLSNDTGFTTIAEAGTVATNVFNEARPVMTNITENVVSNLLDQSIVMYVTNSALTIAQGGEIKWQESFGGYPMEEAAVAKITPSSQSMTFVSVYAGTNTLEITAPPRRENGECRDMAMCVSVVDQVELSFKGDFTNTMFAVNEAYTNALPAGKTTMLYFTEVKSNTWFFARQEAINVTPQN